MSPDADDSDGAAAHEPDPPSLGPEVPSVDVPTVESPGELDGDGTEEGEEFTGDVDADVARTFWRLVVVIDVGIAALALGPMFVYFEGDWQRGLILTAFGLAVLAYGVKTYRRYKAEESGAVDEEQTDEDRTQHPDADTEAVAGIGEGEDPDPKA